jgi:hypothetical protein
MLRYKDIDDSSYLQLFVLLATALALALQVAVPRKLSVAQQQ